MGADGHCGDRAPRGRQLRSGGPAGHVRGKLAGYKTPKHIFVRDTLSRASNGKADYKLMLAHAKK